MARNMNQKFCAWQFGGTLVSFPARAVSRRPKSIIPSTTRASSSFSQTTPQHGSPWDLSAWKNPGPAEFDFRSDVMTRPTISMLQAISKTSLLDDDYQEDSETNSLQEFIAKLTSHESALLVMSGTMGNQVAIRSHLAQPPYSILCDHRAHIIHWEGGGACTWTGAFIKGLIPSNGRHLILEDIQKHAMLDDGGFHGCPTRLISLENTLDGTIMPLDETQRICDWAHKNELKVHLDGARLWEAATAGAGSLTEYAGLFDSVSLCFSKGLGAPIGSMLVGSGEFIRKARWCRKAMGGGTRQAGIITAAARVAVEETFGRGPNGEGGKLRATHMKAQQIARAWKSRGGRLSSPTETNMVWLDLEHAGISGEQWDELGKREGLKLQGSRLVVHYQISDEAIRRLEAIMDCAMTRSKDSSSKQGAPKYYGQPKIMRPYVSSSQVQN